MTATLRDEHEMAYKLSEVCPSQGVAIILVSIFRGLCTDSAGHVEITTRLFSALEQLENCPGLKGAIPNIWCYSEVILKALTRDENHEDILEEWRKLIGNGEYEPEDDTTRHPRPWREADDDL